MRSHRRALPIGAALLAGAVLALPAAGSETTPTVNALAPTCDRNSRQVRVGRLVRASLPAGVVPFAVALDGAAIGALERHGRLALTVKLRLTPVSAPAVTAIRKLLLRP